MGYGGAVATSPGGPALLGSYGWIGGLGTSVLIDPASGMTVIALSQRVMRGGGGNAVLSGAVQAAAFSTHETNEEDINV